jgi:hypothetical protein
MKLKKICFFCAAAAFLFVCFVPELYAAKWKGSWFLRGENECKEIILDRKGKTEPYAYPQALVEKKEGSLYLSVMSLGKKYSYKMYERENTPDYDLELISIGPNLPLPSASKPFDNIYSGMFRMLVDCQTTAFTMKESSVYK